jgi:hypothetical protein
MTTTIFTNLLGPICELYYKSNKDLDLYQANINTIRNYGQSTSFSVNFGFELYQPFDINNILLQPGVYTTNSSLVYQPLALSNSNYTNSVINNIYLQELPVSSSGIVTYINKTLPIVISLHPNPTGNLGVNGLIGIASNYATNGVPYNYSLDSDNAIIRQFESSLVTDSSLSMLIFINLENVNFVGVQTNWSALPTSLYSINVESYRYNNGFGQFFSQTANVSFIPSNTTVDTSLNDSLFANTYNLVYNWINYLTWVPNFSTWLNNNSSSVPTFLRKFLSEYFNL